MLLCAEAVTLPTDPCDVALLATELEDYPAQNDGEQSMDEPTPMNDLFSAEGDEHWIEWLMDCVAIESTIRGRH